MVQRITWCPAVAMYLPPMFGGGVESRYVQLWLSHVRMYILVGDKLFKSQMKYSKSQQICFCLTLKVIANHLIAFCLGEITACWCFHGRLLFISSPRNKKPSVKL